MGKWIPALQDAQAFIRQNIDEADVIVAWTVKLPPGVFKEAVGNKHRVLDVPPAWGKDSKKAIWDRFERAVAAKYPRWRTHVACY